MTTLSSSGIAYDRGGPRGGVPVVLIHAGVADRRMWDEIWAPLTAERDVVRLDLRGFGDSTTPPSVALSPVDDVLDTLDELEIERCHLVGASYGAGVAFETTLTRPSLVESLTLSAPGGALFAEVTPDLGRFIDEEDAAMESGDLDAAVDANLSWWVDGPERDPGDVDPAVRQLVGVMQRRAFEVTADWGPIDEVELEPPAVERYAEIQAPTLVLVGALDLDVVREAARRIAEGVDGARHVEWLDVAHLPSMERPDDFLSLLTSWLPPIDVAPASL
ncbi:alpha/beta fold hydrolase [Stackebrandtia soli]|uniref:alpha/beta fold hydrolase n=1 Tax=Stackebrandtia soli TaxID=1892856 RepID=UPI0039EA3E6C